VFYSIFYYLLGYTGSVSLILIAVGDPGYLWHSSPVYLIILGTALGGGMMAIGARLKEGCRSIWAPKPTPQGARQGIAFLRAARYGALSGGFFTVTIAVIKLLKDFGDPSSLAENMSLGLVGLFWAIFLGFFLLLPLQTRLEHFLLRQGETDLEFSETSLEILLLSSGFLLSCLFLGITFYMF
jgi:hypothetical protein